MKKHKNAPPMDAVLPPLLRKALAGLPPEADPCLAGGCVRDWLLGRVPTDFDVEVYGIDDERLLRALGHHGRVDAVGRSFGVFKLTQADGAIHDFSLPRRDSKVGPGHRGFHTAPDPSLDPREAAARRDFTLNAMLWNLRRGELWDFFGGRSDLGRGILRHTSSAFTEDPLRVLRGMQFAGRFALAGAPETLALCRGIAASHAELPAERIREEWIKWAAKSTRPSAGLVFLKDAGWLMHYPELAALPGVPQDPEWHPEGDVWVHTLHCLDALVRLPDWLEADTDRRVALMFSVLLHDAGKPACTRWEMRDGRERILSPGHEIEGRAIAAAFLERIRAPRFTAERAPNLVAAHMFRVDDLTDRAVRRLAHRLAPAGIRDLLPVLTADAMGRPPRPAVPPSGVEALRAKASAMELASAGPKPLIQGRELVSRGMKPGPAFGEILEAAFEAQLVGEFTDHAGGVNWLERHLAERRPKAGTAE
jgi:tRNA nucleotidyltransferase (CCA-adding enzyme)